MHITDVQTIPLKLMGTPTPKGVGSVLVTPSSTFYDPQRNRAPGGPEIAYMLVQVTTDEGLTGVGSVGAANGHARYTIENHLKYSGRWRRRKICRCCRTPARCTTTI